MSRLSFLQSSKLLWKKINSMSIQKECFQVLYFDRTDGNKKCRTAIKIEDISIKEVNDLEKNFCKKDPKTGIQKQIRCLACQCLIQATQTLREHLKGSNHLEQFSTYITNPTNLVDSISANDITENVNILKKRKSTNNDDDKESNLNNEDVKKAKLEPKSTKKRPPGCEEERYTETSYYLENNLRKVVPYYFVFKTHSKLRWVGEKIIDIFAREFRAHPVEEYIRRITAGDVTVNGEKINVDYVINHNDRIANKVHRHEVPVTAKEIKIIHMDDELVVIDKPSSIPVHPCGRYRHNSVAFIMAKEQGLKDLHTIHRIDRLTSGLLLYARNPKKAKEMAQQIRTRVVNKEYFCRVEGNFPDELITCQEPIGIASEKIGVCIVSSKGKDCHTDFQKLSYNGSTSLVLCKPKTGRMHQIRVHLQFLGHPIINDPLYNSPIFGPQKGKNGITGKTDEQLIEDLIAFHNAEEHALKVDVNNDDDTKNENTLLKRTFPIDPHCYECKVDYKNPRPEELVMYLHAFSYAGNDWCYKTEIPDWARDDWIESNFNQLSQNSKEPSIYPNSN